MSPEDIRLGVLGGLIGFVLVVVLYVVVALILVGAR